MSTDAPQQDGKSRVRGTRRPRRRRKSWIVSAISWLMMLAIWTWALAWVLSGASWYADLLANLGAQGLLVTVVFAAIWLGLRRRALCVLALLACAMHLWIMSTGRAAWIPVEFDPASRVPGAVRLLHYNASHKRPPEEVFAMLATVSADIVSITEPNIPLQVEVIYGDAISERYPHRLKRLFHERGPENRVGAGVVLSRWPLEPYAVGDVVNEQLSEEFIAAIVTVPASATEGRTDSRWGLIAIHPRSPRTAERWAYGSDLVRACAAVSRKMQAEGLPVVVLADLNSTPTGWRSRELCLNGGLYRAKPVLAPEGTYPARADPSGSSVPLIWPATIAIDDAFVSSAIHVRGWVRLDPGGSDHWPVLVELTSP